MSARVRQTYGEGSLLPAPQDRGHDARASMAVHDGNHPERLFVRRVGDEVIPHANETKRTAGEIRASVTLVGKVNECANRGQNLGDDLIGGCEVIGSDVVLNLVQVKARFGVKLVAGHQPACSRSAAALFSRKLASISSPGMSLTLPLLISS